MNQSLILGVFLLLINAGLIISRICKNINESNQIDELWKQRQAKSKPTEEGTEEEKRAKEKQEKEELKDEIEPKQIYSWITGVVICLDVWIIGAIVTHWWAETYFDKVSDTDNQKALFGDSFGAVNALVSALAFAGMIVAFVLQRYELRLQRKELKDNRAEMVQQTSQFVAENKNLEIQRFENLFYNMLNLQQKIVDGLRYEYLETVPAEPNEVGIIGGVKQVKTEAVGRDVFRYLFNEVPINIKNFNRRPLAHGYRHYLNDVGMGKYDSTPVPSYFDHYFRHLYKIVQFVDEQVTAQVLTHKEAYRYLSFLRGTLSRYELVWLYYNALYPEYSKFKILIERYSFLKVLRRDLLTLTWEAEEFYTKRGIGRPELDKTDFGLIDFYYYLTDNPEDKDKYLVSAFCNPESEDYHLCVERLYKWRAFIYKNAKSVVEEENATS